MKKNIYLLLLVSMIIFAGCMNDSNDIDNNFPDETEYDEQTGINGSTELSLYTIDYDTYECVPTVSVVESESEIDASLIVDEVTANFKEDVVIEDIIENPFDVVICFSDNAAPVKNVSEEMEYSMLDCIAYSLLDNLDYCNEVYFRSNGITYESNYISMQNDEPYISK